MSGNLLWLRRQLLENLSIPWIHALHISRPPPFPSRLWPFFASSSGDEAVWKHIYKIIWRKYFFSRALLDESFYFIFLGPSLCSSSCLVLPITSNLSANSFLCCVHGFHLGKLSWWALERFENIYFPFSYFFSHSRVPVANERRAEEWQAITWNSEILILRNRLSHYARDFPMKIGKAESSARRRHKVDLCKVLRKFQSNPFNLKWIKSYHYYTS